MEKIIILGGGGHAKVLIETIKRQKMYDVAGLLDSNLQPGSHISDVLVLGNDDLLPELYANDVHYACIAVGSIRNNGGRKKLYEKAKRSGFDFPAIIHPQAVLSETVKYSEGVQIMAGAIIQPESFIGANTIINTGAIVEHDCKIGAHVHICPGAVVSGGCKIGDGSFIGASATIIQYTNTGEDCLIAAGAVVIKDVPSFFKALGVPARIEKY